MMTGNREDLPNRRRSETREFVHRGQLYFLSASYFPGTQRVAEIFLSSRKPGSEVESVARDGAILVSLCLQHGVDLMVLRHAVTRDDDGIPTTAVGFALDALSVIEIEEAAP